MATGGHKSFTASSYKGSDEIFDFPCTPCANEGNNVEAVNYCTDCSEYFCLACTKDHKKFRVTSGHNVVNRTRAKQVGGGGQAPGALPTERCMEHHGERITTYCADHDVVVCNTCVSVDHRLCGGISYIPKVAGGTKQSEDIQHVKGDISETLITIRKTKASLQKHQLVADEEKKQHLRHIQECTQRLIKHARDLEKTAFEEVNDKHKSTTDTVQSGIKTLGDSATSVENRLKQLDNAHTNSDAQAFVDIKRGKQEVENARQLEGDFKSFGTSGVTARFMLDEVVKSFLNAKALGKICERQPFKAVLHRQCSAKIAGDDTTCKIYGICELSEGKTVLTDFNNNCLKILSHSFKISKSFTLPSPPWGICQTSQTEVAVTLFDDRKVQFVDVRGSWKLTKSFKVEDACRGICFSQGELFVSCGGHPGTEGYDPEGPGFVGVYNVTGHLLRKIQFDLQGRQMFSMPYHVVTNASGDTIHITDKIDGIISVDRHGKVLWTYSTNIQKPLGLTILQDDTLIVCGNESNTVVQIDASGKLVADLLGPEDGIDDPTSVYFSQKSSMLLVTLRGTDAINVFNVLR